ncbi:hypothetical protein DXG03_004185 [Asterophora parasitica]|uniref:Uncharacterized protein n=1 Tax=Asterophora parasitica TaxID=117018 RepID=A0A9P7G0T6_9AGAR|nr:hypothetical protein DXG03_004185 [Asterophora parasitica]
MYAFFARPISIGLVYSNTYHHTSPTQPAVPLTLPNPSVIASASHATPVIQTRQVHLQCSGKIVCTATSTVRITSHEAAHLFLEEKYAIGQMFARLEKSPDFDLLAVGFGTVSADATTPLPEKTPLLSFAAGHEQQQQLWRKYRLSVAGFECDILEVFPSREMFTAGTRWLDVDTTTMPQEWGSTSLGFVNSTKEMPFVRSGFLRPQTVILFLGLGFLLMLAFELSMFFTGRPLFCYL